MKSYLICSADEAVTESSPVIVAAETQGEAIYKYLKVIYSKDETFRKMVLDLAGSVTFVEQFYLVLEAENDRFDATETTFTEDEVIQTRVRAFFAERHDLGESFIRYMKTEDRALIGDEIFEYIAVRETPDAHGFVALDLDSVPILSE